MDPRAGFLFVLLFFAICATSVAATSVDDDLLVGAMWNAPGIGSSHWPSFTNWIFTPLRREDSRHSFL